MANPFLVSRPEAHDRPTGRPAGDPGKFAAPTGNLASATGTEAAASCSESTDSNQRTEPEIPTRDVDCGTDSPVPDGWGDVAAYLQDAYGLELTGEKLAKRMGDREAVTWGDDVVDLADQTSEFFGRATSPTGYFLSCVATYFRDTVLPREAYVAAEKERSRREAERLARERSERNAARQELRALGFKSYPNYNFSPYGPPFTGGPGDGKYDQDRPVEAMAAIKEAEARGCLPSPVLHVHPEVRKARERLRSVEAHIKAWAADIETVRAGSLLTTGWGRQPKIADLERKLQFWQDQLPEALRTLEEANRRFPSNP